MARASKRENQQISNTARQEGRETSRDRFLHIGVNNRGSDPIFSYAFAEIRKHVRRFEKTESLNIYSNVVLSISILDIRF
jgi:hypothetical protein